MPADNSLLTFVMGCGPLGGQLGIVTVPGSGTFLLSQWRTANALRTHVVDYGPSGGSSVSLQFPDWGLFFIARGADPAVENLSAVVLVGYRAPA